MNLSRNSYIICPLRVTLQPIGVPFLNLKAAIDFFAFVTTAFCPETREALLCSVKKLDILDGFTESNIEDNFLYPGTSIIFL